MILSLNSIDRPKHQIQEPIRYDVLYHAGLQLYDQVYVKLRHRIVDNLTYHIEHNCWNVIGNLLMHTLIKK
jgi:hypothetical protein